MHVFFIGTKNELHIIPTHTCTQTINTLNIPSLEQASVYIVCTIYSILLLVCVCMQNYRSGIYTWAHVLNWG